MTRLENLVSAVLKSGIVQPYTVKLCLRVFGVPSLPETPTLEQLNAFADAHDKEVMDRAVSIAQGIAERIADIELNEMRA